MCGDVIVEKAEARPLRGEGSGLVTEKMEDEKEKGELRIASDAEADIAFDVPGVAEKCVVAVRRAAAVGGGIPAPAANHTVR